jgi:hypothetical protein
MKMKRARDVEVVVEGEEELEEDKDEVVVVDVKEEI